MEDDYGKYNMKTSSTDEQSFKENQGENINNPGQNEINEKENVEIIKQSKKIGDLDVISYNCTKTILSQMEKNIYKIKGNEQGTAFTCKIPFPDRDNMLPVLITNNHIINGDLLGKIDSEIKFNREGDKDYTKIKLDNNRMKYTNKTYDITIIELKTNDRINDYLELDKIILDDIIDSDNSQIIKYDDKIIYIPQYPKGELCVSYGIFNGTVENNEYIFKYNCCTDYGSSGSPILNMDNKVIGIHIGIISCNYNSSNAGCLLNFAIKEFINEHYKKSNEKLLIEFNKNNKTQISNTEIISLNLAYKYIGDKGFKDLMKVEFNQIKELKLSYNNISNIDALNKNKLKNLEKLDLSHNLISDIKVLENTKLQNLKELILSSNKISNIGPLSKANYDNLEILDLSNNKIIIIDPLENSSFKRLRVINFGGNRIQNIDVFKRIKFDKLEKLNLRKNKINNIDALKLGNFNELTELNLEGNKIKKIDDSFNTTYNFKKLENLNLAKNQIENISELIAKVNYSDLFSHLKKLNLSNNIIPKQQLEKLIDYSKNNYPDNEFIMIPQKEKKNVK